MTSVKAPTKGRNLKSICETNEPHRSAEVKPLMGLEHDLLTDVPLR
jgi:hypothetical protein